MTQQQTTVIVGVFEEYAQAERAYRALREAGFGADYLGLANPQATGASLNKRDMVEAGVPQDEANYYQHEFDQGRSIVTVRTGGLRADAVQRAAAILKECGAYDAHSGRERQGQYAPNVRSDTPSPYFDLTHVPPEGTS